MCNVCAMTQSFVPDRHEAGQSVFEGIDPQSGTFNETSDAAAGISTTYTMSAGDSFTGSIGAGGDVDWVAITFEAGQEYEIEALGNDSGGGTLNDTDLRLYDANGTLIEYDDYDGAGWDAAITYTAATTGTYYIAVSSYYGGNTGTYTLDVGTSLPPYIPGTEASLAQLAEFLQGGSSGVERKFNTSVSNEITVNLSGLTAEGQQLARWAMEAWEMVADIDFVEVTIGEMITADDEDSGAFAYFPNSGSTAQGVELNVSTGWLSSSGTRIDTYSFQTYIHEFGHAIGLNHQGAYNYTGSPITYENNADFTNDSWQLSVMSYFSQTENTTTDASFAYVTTAQMADIVAIQDFYGAAGAGSVTDGNTVYGQGSNVGNYLDEIFAQWATGATNANIGGNRVAMTLFDVGGVDTLNLGYLASNEAARIDLNGGAFSDIGNEIDILGIADGTVIENLETGAGNDTITGNGAANSIMSGAGNDNIDGGAGADSLGGGDGNDTVDGQSSADLIEGNGGSDMLTGGTGADTISGGEGNDTIYGNTGSDTIQGGAGQDSISAGESEDLVTGGDHADYLIGRTGADTIYGNSGNDDLYGSEGADLLLGGDDDDYLSGGTGNDDLYGQNGNDSLFGNEGSDYLSGGAGDDELRGATGNDLLRGGDGNDEIYGNQGRDTLEGGAGDDILTGGSLTDRFVFYENHGADVIVDFDTNLDRLHLGVDLVDGMTDVGLMLDAYGDASSGTLVLDFGSGNTITLNGIVTAAEIEANIFII